MKCSICGTDMRAPANCRYAFCAECNRRMRIMEAMRDPDARVVWDNHRPSPFWGGFGLSLLDAANPGRTCRFEVSAGHEGGVKVLQGEPSMPKGTGTAE